MGVALDMSVQQICSTPGDTTVMDSRQQNTQYQPPGEIRISSLYRGDELKRRMGWSDSAFRAARRRGLKVRREGKRAYVFGEDLIAYMKGRTE